MKALALFSGGLDSMIAIKLIREQDIEVLAIFCDIGFSGKNTDFEKIKNRAENLGAKFIVLDLKKEYLKEILFSPKYGYGKNFNPCIDCHGFMFKKALEKLDEFGAKFIISGEVLGQRPKSQRKEALGIVRKLANDEQNLILRPLSAKLLPPTKPENEGWVDREKLLNISGRGRNVQLKLAKQYNFNDFESPAGGCLLTYEHFSEKIRDFIKFDKLLPEDIELLKFGRHKRLPNGAKLIIGRNQEDNESLLKIKNDKFEFLILEQDLVGPVSLISKNTTKEDLNLAIKLILTYAKTKPNKIYEVKFGSKTIKEKAFEIKEKAKEYQI